MFRSFTVKNFRCFRELMLSPLERINLIAGKNNSGKTALLEAIHLFCNPNDCKLPLDINQDRGIEDPATDLRGVAAWLFRDHSTSKAFELSSQDENGVDRTLKVSLIDGLDAREILTEQERAEIAAHAPYLLNLTPCLVLGYQKGEAKWVHSIGVPAAVGSGIASISARAAEPIPCRFLTVSRSAVFDDVENFGSLEASERQGEILPALQLLEPRLQRLSLIPFAGKPVIHGDLQGLDRLIPMPLMGEGVRRVLSIVLAIANTAGGVVLIDEVENGLHYSVLKDVWQAIALAARRADVQVFATTHSWECIVNAHEAFEESTLYDLRLHRIDRIEDTTSAVSYNQEMIESALYNAVEMR
ncbi:MAG TPA: AAA family ATPase [Gemmataceae bacterium]|jgi:ABC-type branched-subunit amino acid transport system ATPase component